MSEVYHLTEAPLTKVLMKLAWPIIATNFIQTTYGLVDMIWIGKVGSEAVAAVGTAVFFVNLAYGLFSMVSVGTGVKVSHAIGAGKEKLAKQFIHNGFFMAALLSIIYMGVIFVFNRQLIGFFELNDPGIEKWARGYLCITIIGMIFTFFNNLFSVILNALGNSVQPFRLNMVGFVLNLLLDPFFIFGIGIFPKLGIHGAAIATLISNFVVTWLFMIKTKDSILFSRPFSFRFPQMGIVIKLGIPITLQRMTFTMISIIIAKIIATWGAEAIGVQRVGIQIESISYMTAAGLQGAVAAFVGQNYGANRLDRIRQGYCVSLLLTTIFGLLITAIFVLFPKTIFSIFLSDGKSLELGIHYLQIIGLSQLFMCLEIMTVGAFNGIGKTYIPPIFSIIFTALRIPMALIFSKSFGLNGVWLAISLSSVIKGIILVSWFLWTTKRMSQKMK